MCGHGISWNGYGAAALTVVSVSTLLCSTNWLFVSRQGKVGKFGMQGKCYILEFQVAHLVLLDYNQFVIATHLPHNQFCMCESRMVGVSNLSERETKHQMIP